MDDLELVIFRQWNRRGNRWRIEGDAIGQLHPMRGAATVFANGDSTFVDESTKGGARVLGELTTEPAIETISHILGLYVEVTSFGSSGARRPLSCRHHQPLVQEAPDPQRSPWGRWSHPARAGPLPVGPDHRW